VERESELGMWRRSCGGSLSDIVFGEEASELLGGGGDLEPAHGSGAAGTCGDVNLEDMAQKPRPRAPWGLEVAEVGQLELKLRLVGRGLWRWR
jgi:hypothetical protein